MPITIKYADIRNPMFINALGKLATYSFKNSRVGYNVAKIVRRVKGEGETHQELWIKLLKQHALLDEKGNFVPNKDESGKDIPGTFSVPEEKSETYQKAVTEFIDIEVELDCHKVRIDQLEEVGLNAHEMNAIETMLIELEAVPAADTAATA